MSRGPQGNDTLSTFAMQPFEMLKNAFCGPRAETINSRREKQPFEMMFRSAVLYVLVCHILLSF